MTRPATGLLPALRLRPLPRTVAPLHNEGQDSYIERLARANRMIPLELREHLTDPRRIRPANSHCRRPWPSSPGSPWTGSCSPCPT